MKPAAPGRLAAVCAVVAVHALVAVAFVYRRPLEEIPVALPIQASIIDGPASEPETPLPDPHVMPPPEVVISEPIVSITLEDPPPEPVPAADSAPADAPPQEAVVEARFDADYLNNPSPIYPSVARRLQEEGLVVLKVRVNAVGGSEAVLVHQSSGSQRLDEAALAAVKKWRFVPAKRGAQPVESWVLVPIEFELGA